MKRIFIASSFFIFLLNFSDLRAESNPKSLSTDKRIKMVVYDPNNVVILKEKYGYQTQITFDANESIQNVSIGDSLAWQVVPVNNNLFLKPMAPSKTNMTVLTNVNSYNFELDSMNVNTPPTYKLQFIYPDGGYDLRGNTNIIGNFDPERLNWKYSFTGSRELVPIEAFDNSQFTFFKFSREGLNKLPAIFIVDKDKKESLVNFHIQGDYVVIHSLAKQFTFRNGNVVTSIYNDFLIGDWKNIA